MLISEEKRAEADKLLSDLIATGAESQALLDEQEKIANDLNKDMPLKPGTEVYLKPKKKQAVKGLEKHVVDDGETMQSISQRYGVRLKNLYKMNDMAEYDVPREGDIIKLRK